MGLLDWLFGKKEKPATPIGPERPEPARAERATATAAATQEPARAEKPTPAPAKDAEIQQPPPAAAPEKEKQIPPAPMESREALPSEGDNLRRWRESGQARSWVQARQGQWGHADWLTLLDELQRSPFWPMHPEAVGVVLEEEKRQCGQPN